MEVPEAATASSKKPPCTIRSAWTLWMGQSKERRVMVLRKSEVRIVVLFNRCVDGARRREVPGVEHFL